jgi:hypothetical protein
LTLKSPHPVAAGFPDDVLQRACHRLKMVLQGVPFYSAAVPLEIHSEQQQAKLSVESLADERRDDDDGLQDSATPIRDFVWSDLDSDPLIG